MLDKIKNRIRKLVLANNNLKQYKIFFLIVFLAFIFFIILALCFKSNTSLYTKLEQHKEINMLIVGDSISGGYNKENLFFIDLFKDYLKEKYGVKVKIKNISVGATSTFCGIINFWKIKKSKNFDIIIVCYGHNDNTENFAVFYESLIKNIKNKYPKSVIIPIKEGSYLAEFSNYKEKMKVIDEIAKKYGLYVADVISEFQKTPYRIEQLTDTYKVHPIDKGQQLYFNAVKSAFENNIKSRDKQIASLENIKIYRLNNFKMIDENIYQLKLRKNNVFVGIDYKYHYGNKLCEIYVDNNKIYEVKTDEDFPKDAVINRIYNLSPYWLNVKNDIKIIFKDKAEKNFFNGLIITYP